jgi:3-hydroxyisobutyrate dehydrogenase
VKIPKLVERDFSVQAATSDAFTSCQLIADAAHAASIASPLLDLSKTLYGENVDLGNSRLDMISVIKSIENRTITLAHKTR